MDLAKEVFKERERLRKALCSASRMISCLQVDIWQTARVNQGNLNGVDPNFPNDKPCQEWIGKHHVHQQGVDESLRLAELAKTELVAIDAALSPSPDARKDAEAKRADCDFCLGSGIDPAGSGPCPKCHGSGRVPAERGEAKTKRPLKCARRRENEGASTMKIVCPRADRRSPHCRKCPHGVPHERGELPKCTSRRCGARNISAGGCRPEEKP
jgi:hypothetical protein